MAEFLATKSGSSARSKEEKLIEEVLQSGAAAFDHQNPVASRQEGEIKFQRLLER